MEKNPKVWLITGCSSGFGRAIAEAVLDAGDCAVVTARDPRTLDALVEKAQDRVLGLPLDVTDPASVSMAIQTTLTRWGRVDVLVNNAGSAVLGSVEETSEAATRRIFETNFFGPAGLIRELLPHLRTQGGGHIVNISAAAAIVNYPGFGAYGAAKAALEAYSESLRAETEPLGIKVTIVQPGPFRTEFIAKSLEVLQTVDSPYGGSVGKFGTLLARMNGRQPGDPARAAELIVLLVREGTAPFRLPLGAYAVKKARDQSAANIRELEPWATMAAATDFAKS